MCVCVCALAGEVCCRAACAFQDSYVAQTLIQCWLYFGLLSQVFGTPTSLSFSFSSASVSLTLLTNICLISSSFFWSSPKNSFLLVSYVSWRLGKKANEIQALWTPVSQGWGKASLFVLLKGKQAGKRMPPKPAAKFKPRASVFQPSIVDTTYQPPIFWGASVPN